MMALCVILLSSTLGAGAVSFSNNVDVKSKSVLIVSMDSGQGRD